MVETSTASISMDDFEQGLNLSRNFKQRTKQETTHLYSLIQWAVLEAQDPQSKNSEASLAFITSVFEPLIRKVATRIYPQIYKHEEFNDILQETYVTFLQLVYAYDPVISSFPYYVSKMLPQQVKAWSNRVSKRTASPIDITILENYLTDPLLEDKSKSSSRYESYVLMQEYEEFILLRAQKKAKSDTVKQVCYDYFLGGKTCSEIAEERNISYHAVYEVIKRIERELRKFLQDHAYMDSAGDLQ